jgi:hypothetical protein
MGISRVYVDPQKVIPNRCVLTIAIMQTLYRLQPIDLQPNFKVIHRKPSALLLLL